MADLRLIAAALAASTTQTTPTLPGGVLAWIVCNSTKRNPIGGWLMLYYWNIYTSVVVGVALFWSNIQSYVPENFANGQRYELFLASAAPAIVLLLAQCAVATFLLCARTWGMLRLLRWTIAAYVVASIISVVIDANTFPDNLFFSGIALATEAIWLAYLFRSTRVRHVFKLHDWDIAVNAIHPPKLKTAS